MLLGFFFEGALSLEIFFRIWTPYKGAICPKTLKLTNGAKVDRIIGIQHSTEACVSFVLNSFMVANADYVLRPLHKGKEQTVTEKRDYLQCFL